MTMFGDKRSRRIVIVSHCILNQNAKLEGIASWRGLIEPVVEVLWKSGVGIIQMPCPEMLYEGIRRFDKSVEQYSCPAFRKLCERIAEDVVDQVEDYLDNGYKVLAILAIDGSPSCGYNLTQSAPEWRGLVAGRNLKKVRYIKGRGVFMEILEKKLSEKGIQIPFLGIPEIPELGSMEEAIAKFRLLLES
ncbi:DUF523 domain-containing protein [Candidatus Bathyarchaeota archaeon]|nr:MAG: DUF523 domain-containing protein [Candidatus Bathyarchaeota archaeon]